MLKLYHSHQIAWWAFLQGEVMQLRSSNFRTVLRMFREATREIRLPHFVTHPPVMDVWLRGLEQRGLAVYVLTRTMWNDGQGGLEETDWNSVNKVTSAGQCLDEYYDYDSEYPAREFYFIGPKDLM
jgi:hypothetical protein